jgi:hypothetical protein
VLAGAFLPESVTPVASVEVVYDDASKNACYMMVNALEHFGGGWHCGMPGSSSERGRHDTIPGRSKEGGPRYRTDLRRCFWGPHLEHYCLGCKQRLVNRVYYNPRFHDTPDWPGNSTTGCSCASKGDHIEFFFAQNEVGDMYWGAKPPIDHDHKLFGLDQDDLKESIGGIDESICLKNDYFVRWVNTPDYAESKIVRIMLAEPGDFSYMEPSRCRNVANLMPFCEDKECYRDQHLSKRNCRNVACYKGRSRYVDLDRRDSSKIGDCSRIMLLSSVGYGVGVPMAIPEKLGTQVLDVPQQASLKTKSKHIVGRTVLLRKQPKKEKSTGQLIESNHVFKLLTHAAMERNTRAANQLWSGVTPVTNRPGTYDIRLKDLDRNSVGLGQISGEKAMEIANFMVLLLLTGGTESEIDLATLKEDAKQKAMGSNHASPGPMLAIAAPADPTNACVQPVTNTTNDIKSLKQIVEQLDKRVESFEQQIKIESTKSQQLGKLLETESTKRGQVEAQLEHVEKRLKTAEDQLGVHRKEKTTRTFTGPKDDIYRKDGSEDEDEILLRTLGIPRADPWLASE